MAQFDVFDPLKDVTLRFTEEQLDEIVQWFDGKSKPLLRINEGEPINVITVKQLLDFLALKKFHKRSFIYPDYGDVMRKVEKLKAETARMLTKEQVIYILDQYIVEPELRHEFTLAFKVFDTENRDFFDIEQLQRIVTERGNVFNNNEIIELLRDANVRGDGNVFYEEFIDSLFKVAPDLYKIKAEYLYINPDEDPSVPPDPEPEPEEPPPAPPPPPPPKKGAKKK